VKTKSICNAKASVELTTAPQFDVIIKNYDLDTALEERINGEKFCK
jgi:hypothetical protein